MALMPESWLNMPMVMARKIGNRYLRLKRGSSFCKLSRWMELTISCSAVSGSSAPIFCRTWRAAEEHDQKQDGRQRGDAKLPAPLGRTESLAGDNEIREVSQQDADDDVDLKHADQATANSCRREFRDVNGTKDG